MMTPSRLLKTVLLGLTLFCSAGAVPDWSKVRVAVEPGVGTEHFHLGEPVPSPWPKELGAPDLDFPFHCTGEGIRRFTWGVNKKGQLYEGIAVMIQGRDDETSITDIELKRIRAGVDAENLFLGMPEGTISKRSDSVQKDGKTSFLLPGLFIETANGKMIGLKIHSPASTRWRFQRWRVRPGQAAGPIHVGKPIEKTLYQSIGEPHSETPEELVWKAADSEQTLKVTRDKRTKEVTRIKGIGLPWRTPNGVTVGDDPKVFAAKHSNAKSGMGRNYDESILKIPGLRATFFKNKLISFDVYPIPKDER